MSYKEVKMYEEMLELLEERHSNGEIDEDNYNELKDRYSQKLESARKSQENQEKAPGVYTAGYKSESESAISVSGSAKFSAGEVVKDIKIAGSAKLDGDITCNQLKAAGSVKSKGSITAHGDVKCAGSFKCEGFLHGFKDAKFSGSAKIGGETVIQGRIGVSGSFGCRSNVQADKGAVFSGSVAIGGNLISQATIEVEGKIIVDNDLVTENVFINEKRGILRSRRSQRISEIGGNVFATGEIFLANIEVKGDVKGKKVTIGPRTKIGGNIYYVDDLSLEKKIELKNEPIQITLDQLKL